MENGVWHAPDENFRWKMTFDTLRTGISDGKWRLARSGREFPMENGVWHAPDGNFRWKMAMSVVWITALTLEFSAINQSHLTSAVRSGAADGKPPVEDSSCAANCPGAD